MAQLWGEELVVTSSGLAGAAKAAVVQAVEAAGARYSPSLSRRCTHLVVQPGASEPPSLKVQQALRNLRKWDVHIVTPEWLEASASRQQALPAGPFFPRFPPAAPAQERGGREERTRPGAAESKAPAPTAHSSRRRPLSRFGRENGTAAHARDQQAAKATAGDEQREAAGCLQAALPYRTLAAAPAAGAGSEALRRVAGASGCSAEAQAPQRSAQQPRGVRQPAEPPLAAATRAATWALQPPARTNGAARAQAAGAAEARRPGQLGGSLPGATAPAAPAGSRGAADAPGLASSAAAGAGEAQESERAAAAPEPGPGSLEGLLAGLQRQKARAAGQHRWGTPQPQPQPQPQPREHMLPPRQPRQPGAGGAPQQAQPAQQGRAAPTDGPTGGLLVNNARVDIAERLRSWTARPAAAAPPAAAVAAVCSHAAAEQAAASSAPPQPAAAPARSQAGPLAAAPVFGRMDAMLDPELSAADVQRVRALIDCGGGRLSVGRPFLGCRATHVVCYPEAANKWLAIGASIVSPDWLERSAAAGSQQKCLHISPDSLQHLPPAAAPAPPSPPPPCAAPAPPATGRGGSGPRLCPARLLEGLLWAVTEPAAAARVHGDATPSPGRRAAAEAVGSPRVGRRLRPAEREEVVFRGSALTLLLPLDGGGAAGHTCRSVPVPAHGLTLAGLLAALADFYQGPEGAGAAAALGAAVHLEALVRVSRGSGACIYEVSLMA